MKMVARRIANSELMVWLLLCAVSLYILYPLRSSLRFGIDLVGGTYLTLEVKTEKAVEAELVAKMQNIETKFKREHTVSLISKKLQDNSIILSFENVQQAQEAARILKIDEPELTTN